MSVELIISEILDDIITAVVNDGESQLKTDDVKPRTVYLLKRTDKPDDGTNIYVGSTSMTLTKRLVLHRSRANTLKKGYEDTKLYVRMREVGVDNWEVLPLLVLTCDKKSIRGFEKEWFKALCADLNTFSPFMTKQERKRSVNKSTKLYYQRNIQNKLYHCDVCDKFFQSNSHLKSHLNTTKHQYAYLNSVD